MANVYPALASVICAALLADTSIDVEERSDVNEGLLGYAICGDLASELILEGLDFAEIENLCSDVWDLLQDVPGIRAEMAAEDLDRD